MSLFSTLNFEVVRRIAMKVVEGSSSIKDMPSFNEVMGMKDLCHEVFSLLPVRIPKGEEMHLTRAEVRQLIRSAALPASEPVEGRDNPSKFEDIFPKRASEVEDQAAEKK